jgi:hypothetical protein
MGALFMSALFPLTGNSAEKWVSVSLHQVIGINIAATADGSSEQYSQELPGFFEAESR